MRMLTSTAVALALVGLLTAGCEQGGPGQTGSPGGPPSGPAGGPAGAPPPSGPAGGGAGQAPQPAQSPR